MGGAVGGEHPRRDRAAGGVLIVDRGPRSRRAGRHQSGRPRLAQAGRRHGRRERSAGRARDRQGRRRRCPRRRRACWRRSSSIPMRRRCPGRCWGGSNGRCPGEGRGRGVEALPPIRDAALTPSWTSACAGRTVRSKPALALRPPRVPAARHRPGADPWHRPRRARHARRRRSRGRVGDGRQRRRAGHRAAARNSRRTTFRTTGCG